MQQDFDPYFEWLGFSGGHPPGTHYELLGLRPFEGDLTAILRAADGSISRVRAVRPGPRLAEWQRLLDQLSRAKVCLLDPGMKAAYDAALRGQQYAAPSAWPAAAQPAFSPPAPSQPAVAPSPAAPFDWGGVMPGASGGQPGYGPVSTNGPAWGTADTMSTPLTVAPSTSGTSTPYWGGPTTPAAGASPVYQPFWAVAPAAAPAEPTAGPSPTAAQWPTTGPSPVQDGGLAETAAVPTTSRPAGQRVSAKTRRPPWLVWSVPLLMLVALVAVALVASRLGSGGGQSGLTSASSASITDSDQGAVAPVQAAKTDSADRPGSGPPASRADGSGRPVAAHSAKRSPLPETKPAVVEVAQAAGTKKGDAAQPDGDAPRAGAAAQPEPAEAGGDRAKRTAFQRAVAEARAAMGDRKLRDAAEHIKTARANAQSAAEQTRADRLETLLNDLKEFWKGMAKVLASFQPGEELSIGGAMMIVVAADGREITFRSEGRNQSYSLDTLPAKLVAALARMRFAKTASSNALLAAFVAVDPNGDPALARRLWQEATRQGLDMSDLMAEFAGGEAPAGPQKTPIPTDSAKLQQAEQAVKQKFQDEFDQATSLAKKAELANRLLELARSVGEKPELRFVLLRQCKDLAVAAGKPELACQAVDEIARFHSVDALAMKGETLEQAAKGAHSLQAYRDVAEQALKVVEEAAGAGRAEEAKRALTTAFAMAQKSRNVGLVRRVQAMAQQLESSPARPRE